MAAAAPAIVRVASIMPVKAAPPIHATFSASELMPRVVVRGVDAYGHEMVEVLRLGDAGQEMFKRIDSVLAPDGWFCHRELGYAVDARGKPIIGYTVVTPAQLHVRGTPVYFDPVT